MIDEYEDVDENGRRRSRWNDNQNTDQWLNDEAVQTDITQIQINQKRVNKMMLISQQANVANRKIIGTFMLSSLHPNRMQRTQIQQLTKYIQPK